jgi:hypothetical protein
MVAGQALAATLVEMMAVVAQEVEVVPVEMAAVLVVGTVPVEVMEVEMGLAEAVVIAHK